jgi:hypothetical protein
MVVEARTYRAEQGKQSPHGSRRRRLTTFAVLGSTLLFFGFGGPGSCTGPPGHGFEIEVLSSPAE